MTSVNAKAVPIDDAALGGSIGDATRGLLDFKQPDGHFVFELEADATIPSEYVLLRHYLGEPVDAALEGKIAAYLRRIQGAHGGWPLVHDGPFDMSASVKAYFALKMIGDSVDAPHMARAREAILSRGGAANVNVFTRFLLSFFEVLTWRSVPVLPVEIMLLPMWSPFHLNKISYWARTTMVPLMVLAALKPRARNPRGIGIRELFLQDPATVGTPKRAPHQNPGWFALFSGLDRILRTIEPLFPKRLRARAIKKAITFVEERLNGEDGLGAIFPPMANAVMMYEALGFPPEHQPRAVTRRGLDRLLVIRENEAYCQPCVSPIWDTSLACHALLEAGGPEALNDAGKALDWLLPKQELVLKGDWAVKRPDVRPGGWAFQYANAYYPDLDDTAVVVMAMDRARRDGRSDKYNEAIARGREWIEGMQSRDGGFAAFDADNLEYYLNNIPFSDHAALLDPPTEDVTARCVSMLAQLGETVQSSPSMAAGVDYLRRTQLAEGSWYGRWGLNYIYGTWSVLGALNAAGVDHQDPAIRKAMDWLVSIQNADGGWGEDAISYRLDYKGFEGAATTASQTAWALLALMAGGEVENPAVARGMKYLIDTQSKKGLWDEQRYTATGFPRVFYLRYHGYSKFSPALGAGAVSEFEKHQQQGGRGRDVNLGAAIDVSVGNAFDLRPVLIVTGLVQEARIAAGPGMTVICSSSNPEQLRALLEGFDPSSVRGVISFGVAGGLDPSLKSGDVVVATEVVDGESRWQAGLALSEELIDGSGLGGQKVVRAGLAGVEQVVVGQAGKAVLHAETGASAVDMESHIAAAYATEAGLPFAALRVISDPATRGLPAIARSAIKPNGNIDLKKVLGGLARNPLTLRALVSTGIDFNRALRSLRDCRGFLLGGGNLVAADI